MSTKETKLIARPRYMEWLSRWRDKDVVKVVTGLRSCGKSSVLTFFRRELERTGTPPENIVSINFESLKERYPREAEALIDHIVGRLAPGTNYVFLDEV